MSLFDVPLYTRVLISIKVNYRAVNESKRKGGSESESYGIPSSNFIVVYMPFKQVKIYCYLYSLYCSSWQEHSKKQNNGQFMKISSSKQQQ